MLGILLGGNGNHSTNLLCKNDDYVEIICSQKISGTSKKGKQRHESDDVFMAESLDEAMADPPTASDSEQWSLFEILSPLAEKLIQDSVSVVDLHIMYVFIYIVMSINKR